MEQTRRAFLDLKQDVKSLFKRLHGLYHCPTVECLPETPTQVDFFVMESIFKGQSWPAEPPIDVLELRQKAASVPLRSTNSVLRPHVDMALQGGSSMASSQLAAPSSASSFFITEPAFSTASSSSSCTGSATWVWMIIVSEQHCWSWGFCFYKEHSKFWISLHVFILHPNRFHWHWLIRNSHVLRLPRNLQKDLHLKELASCAPRNLIFSKLWMHLKNLFVRKKNWRKLRKPPPRKPLVNVRLQKDPRKNEAFVHQFIWITPKQKQPLLNPGHPKKRRQGHCKSWFQLLPQADYQSRLWRITEKNNPFKDFVAERHLVLGSPCAFLPFFAMAAPGLDVAMRRKLQAYVHIYDFLTDEVWEELLNPEMPRRDKIVSLVSHSAKLGLQNASEPTFGMLCALCHWTTWKADSQAPMTNADFVSMKQEIRTALDQCVSKGVCGPWLQQLPSEREVFCWLWWLGAVQSTNHGICGISMKRFHSGGIGTQKAPRKQYMLWKVFLRPLQVAVTQTWFLRHHLLLLWLACLNVHHRSRFRLCLFYSPLHVWRQKVLCLKNRSNPCRRMDVTLRLHALLRNQCLWIWWMVLCLAFRHIPRMLRCLRDNLPSVILRVCRLQPLQYHKVWSNHLPDLPSLRKKPAAKPKAKACGKAKAVAKVNTVKKRPAVKKSAKLDFPKGEVSLHQRKLLKPQGCSRCRHSVGCSPSCWAYKGYKALSFWFEAFCPEHNAADQTKKVWELVAELPLLNLFQSRTGMWCFSMLPIISCH